MLFCCFYVCIYRFYYVFLQISLHIVPANHHCRWNRLNEGRWIKPMLLYNLEVPAVLLYDVMCGTDVKMTFCHIYIIIGGLVGRWKSTQIWYKKISKYDMCQRTFTEPGILETHLNTPVISNKQNTFSTQSPTHVPHISNDHFTDTVF